MRGVVQKVHPYTRGLEIWTEIGLVKSAEEHSAVKEMNHSGADQDCESTQMLHYLR